MTRRINPVVVLPAILFAGFVGIMSQQLLHGSDNSLPSVLVGRTVPGFELEPLGTYAPPTVDELLAPGTKLVNFWASWCGPCRVEHPNLVALASAGVPILGVNYKDTENNGLSFLRELGNPYVMTGADPEGRIAIDWGVYGIPETFVVDGEGIVRLRHAGPITGRVLQETVLPEIRRLNQDKDNAIQARASQ